MVTHLTRGKRTEHCVGNNSDIQCCVHEHMQVRCIWARFQALLDISCLMCPAPIPHADAHQARTKHTLHFTRGRLHFCMPPFHAAGISVSCRRPQASGVRARAIASVGMLRFFFWLGVLRRRRTVGPTHGAPWFHTAVHRAVQIIGIHRQTLTWTPTYLLYQMRA